MSDPYETIESFIEELQEKDIELTRVVVPARHWKEVKGQADRVEDEGWPKSRINGVKITYKKLSQPRAIINFGDSDE